MYDLLLKNGTIIDGTGKKAYLANLAIKDGKIAYIGNNENIKSESEIDCNGKCIAPGFIDVHSHGDLSLGNIQDELERISQGITTQIGGHCGSSIMPIRMKNIEIYNERFYNLLGDIDKETLKEFESIENYLNYVDKNKTLNINCKSFVGHLPVRLAAMGLENRFCTQDELEEMKDMVRDAMENGALGISSGLIYTPGVYSNTEEILELCKVVKEYNGIYATHLRSESDEVIESMKEAIYIAKTSGIPLLISHHKVMGKDNWGLSKKTLELIDEEIAQGVDIILDQYPYEAGMTLLELCVPPQYLSKGSEGLAELLRDKEKREEIKNEILNPSTKYENFYKNSGGFSGVLVAACTVQEAIGKTISEYAKEIGKDEFDAYFDLLIESKGNALANYFAVGVEDLERIILHPNTMIGTDGIPAIVKGPGHPRNCGTFTKAIRWYVKERELMSIEEMIYKMTLLPALNFKLKDKGALLKGNDADIVIFNYDKIKDNSTYESPKELSSGIDFVLLDGQVIYKDMRLVKTGVGKYLR